ncbi:hypothetical protein ACOMHN_008424 [Nucella lapillus]
MASYFGSYTDCLSILGALGVCYVGFTVGSLLLRVAWRTIGRKFLPVDVKQYGRWAVVTGCTDGIGKCYALELAEKGMDIVLISRNPQKLSAVEEDIVSQYLVSVKVITADFKETDIYDKIKKQLSGLDIGILVNNVGMAIRENPCYFCEADDFEQSNRDLVNVNVLSSVMMTSIVLPGMLERKRGAIVSLGSTAGMRPMPFLSTYSATKGFVRFFSEALNQEYSSHGIIFQVLQPGMVVSNLAGPIAKAVDLPQGSLMYPMTQVYVRAALSTLGRESCSVAYWPHELQFWIVDKLPNSLFTRLLALNRNKMAKMLKNE